MKKQYIIYGLVLMGLIFCRASMAGSVMKLTIDKAHKEVYFSQIAIGITAAESGGNYSFGWTGGATSGSKEMFTLANNSVSLSSGTSILSASFDVYNSPTGLVINFSTGPINPGSVSVTGGSVHSSYASLSSTYRNILENYTGYLPSITTGSQVYIETIPEPATITLLIAAATGVLARRRK